MSSFASLRATPGPSRPSSISCRRSGSATAGPGKTASPNLSFETRPTRGARQSSPRTRSSAHGSSPRALIPQGVRLRFCFATTRPMSRKSLAAPPSTPYPKDGINDHVVNGAATVNPERFGTKMAVWHRVTVGAGETVEIRLRLARDTPGRTMDLGAGLRTNASRPKPRSRRILRRAPPARRDRRRSDGDAASLRGNELEPAIL